MSAAKCHGTGINDVANREWLWRLMSGCGLGVHQGVGVNQEWLCRQMSSMGVNQE